MTTPHTHRLGFATILTTLALTTGGCVSHVTTTASTVPPQAAAPQDTTPEATMPNLPGREFPGQLETYAPAPRDIAPEDIPDYSWMTHEFDHESPDFDMFDPCLEIPAEVYERIGLTLWDSRESTPTSVLCSLQLSDKSSVEGISVAADRWQAHQLENSPYVLGDATDSVIPQSRYYAVGSGVASESNCAIDVPTPRGRVWMLYAYPGSPGKNEQYCPLVRDYFEAFIAQPEVQQAIWGDLAR